MCEAKVIFTLTNIFQWNILMEFIYSTLGYIKVQSNQANLAQIAESNIYR